MALKERLVLCMLALATGVPAGPNEGSACIVLVSRSPKDAGLEKLALEITGLRDRAKISRDRLPVAILSWSEPAQKALVEHLGFDSSDLPLATTGVVDSAYRPISANLNRPPVSLDPKWVSFYLVNEWSRREEHPPLLPQPEFPAAPQGSSLPGKTNATDGCEMAYIPDGRFWRGSCDGEIDEFPPKQVDSKGFYLAKTEVTVSQFRAFVEAQKYQTLAEREGFSWCWSDGNWRKVSGANWRSPKGEGSQARDSDPVAHVSLEDAKAYCAWAGLRLPREDEWEKAARGAGGRRYPWGSNWADRSKDTSLYGCRGMASGVREWTDSPFTTYHPEVVIKEPRAGRFVIRGGALSDGARECRSSYRFVSLPTGHSDILGFRTAWSAEPKLGSNP